MRPLPPKVRALVAGLVDEVRLNAPEDHDRTAEQRERAAIDESERHLADIRRELQVGTCKCEGDEPNPCEDPECLVHFGGDALTERDMDKLHDFLDGVLDHAGVRARPHWRSTPR